MCLIAYKPAGIEFPSRLLLSTFARNRDGFGIMLSNEDDTIYLNKVQPTSSSEIEKMLPAFKDRNAAFHWRMKTHGHIDLENVHPYQILSKDEHGLDMYMMHNGVLSCVNEVDSSKSDTWHFIEAFLRPLLAKDPDLVYDEKFQNILGDMIGTNNKFLIMRGDTKEPIIINRTSGTSAEKYGGCWLSNTYAFTDPSDKSAYTTRHLGGYSYRADGRGSYYGQDDWGYDADDYKNDNMKEPTSEDTKEDATVLIDVTATVDFNALAALSMAQLECLVYENPDYAVEALWDLIHGA